MLKTGKIIFECSGLKDTVRFRLENGSVFISESPQNDEFMFKEKDLILISYTIQPWMIRGCNNNIELTFTYSENCRQKKKSIIMSGQEKNVTELLDFLQDRYGEICRIGPTEKERAEMRSPAYSASYGLHDLNILTPLGVISGLLIIATLVLYLMIATTDQAIMPNPGKMNRVGIIIMMISMIPLGIMHLITSKRLMVVRTAQKGLTVRKLLSNRHYQWDLLTLKAQKPAVHKVYRGLYCEASDHGEVVAAKALIDVSFFTENKKVVRLLMPVNEVSRFYRELYYRNIVSLEEAQQNRAFL